ncbi:MAG: metallophosphoesterase [Clostridiaceae bacterium]|nr:metallophosphoesterase [Clostridiaceae bacterium]
MDILRRISQVFEVSEQIPFDDSSRIVFMSDCHRGDGSWADDFLKNQNLYFAALTYYYKNNFTYIEIGDGDELWENSSFDDIKQVHSNVFWLLSKFYNEGRLHMIFGNHDMIKRDKRFVRTNMCQYFNEPVRMYVPLFENVKFHEGLILDHRPTGGKVFLIHGHQGDCLNDRLWKLARFLVRHLWRPLTIFGVNDPTRTAKNYKKKETAEKKYIEWVLKEKHMLIAGHTHRPMFPEPGEPPYFNDGSCVHPRCITAIEIEYGYIILVKWTAKTKDDGTLYVGREVLAGPKELKDYFNYKDNQEDKHYMRIFV